MKNTTKEGLHIKCQKEGKEFFTAEEERKFWEMNLSRTSSAKSLLYTVYFYNEKIFGLRGGDHRNIVLNNFELGSNFIKFQENSCKAFHEGVSDLKYIPRTVKHICHEEGVKHKPCLVEIHRLYIGLVEVFAKNGNAFYYKASKAKFGLEKVPVGINTLNMVLPDLCEAAGVKRKTAHCLRVTCASSLFNAGVEEKLIRERTGHRSNVLLKYEKPSEENKGKVSYLLGPNAVLSTSKGETCKQENEKPLSSLFNAAFHEGTFQRGLCHFHVVNNFSNYESE